MAVRTAERPSVSAVRSPLHPGAVLSRADVYKGLVDLLIGLTGRTEAYACLTVEGGDLVVTLSDSEYDARRGARG